MTLGKNKHFPYMSTPKEFSSLPQLLKINQNSAGSQKTFLETGKCGLGTDPFGKGKLRNGTVWWKVLAWDSISVVNLSNWYNQTLKK